VPGLDAWLPRYDQRERHEVRIERPPDEALAAALAVPAEPDWIVATLFRLRGLDARGKSLGELFAPPWATVLERTPTVFVAKVNVERDSGTGSILSLRQSPIEIVFDLRARFASGGSVLATETRVAGGGRRFRV
jgi:hypothetical protein